MKSAISILALVGLTAAQGVAPETTMRGVNGDLIIERRQETSYFELANEISTLKATVSTQSEQLGALMAGGAASAVAADMASRTMGLMSAATANAEGLAAVQGTVASMQATVTAQLGTARAEQATAAASTAAAMTSNAAAQAAVLSTTTATITRSISVSAAAIDAQVSSSLAGMTSTIIAANASLTTMVSGKANAMKHIWVGGARDWGGGGGMRQFSLTRFDYDTLSPKGRKDGNYLRVLATGMFKAHYWGIQHGGGHGHGRFYFNNQPLTDHYHNSKEWGWWNDLTMHLDWKLTANGRFELRLSSGGHRWHHGNVNNGNAYNRLSFMWMGPAGDRCNGCIT